MQDKHNFVITLNATKHKLLKQINRKYRAK
jgi:hypothetical protein